MILHGHIQVVYELRKIQLLWHKWLNYDCNATLLSVSSIILNRCPTLYLSNMTMTGYERKVHLQLLVDSYSHFLIEVKSSIGLNFANKLLSNDDFIWRYGATMLTYRVQYMYKEILRQQLVVLF